MKRFSIRSTRCVMLGIFVLLTLTSMHAQQPAVTEIPMFFDGNRPMITVMINGKGPYNFLVDTGAAGFMRADTSLVAALSLPVSGQRSASDANNKTETRVDEVTIQKLDVHGLKFENVTAFSRNYNTSSYLPHIDGILGFELFTDYLLIVDFPRKRIVIQKGELPRPNGKTVLPLKIVDGNPVIDITVGTSRREALIDTGNMRAIDVSAAFIKETPLFSFPRIIGRGGSASGEFEVREVQLQSPIMIGKFSFPNPPVTFSDAFEEINIGCDLLHRFAITFDQKNKRVRFTY